MKRLTILFFLILFIISGCSLYNKSNSKSVNAEIRDIFLPSKISFRGDVEYGNDLIYGTVFRSNLIKIFFYDLKGNLKNKLQIKRGKGPGKAVNVRESLIKNDKLYLFDSSQNKIIIYSISGEHIKDINIDIDDVIIDFELSKKYYYFEGLLNYKLIQMERETKNIVNKIYYENRKEVKSYKDIMNKKRNTGVISLNRNDNRLYFGHFNRPYRINSYNKKLNKIQTYTRKINGNYKDYMITENGSEGSMIINSIEFCDSKIYSAFGGGYTISKGSKGVKLKGIPTKFYISVFDKKSGNFKYEINIDILKELNGFANLLHADKKKLILQIRDMGDTLKNIDYSVNNEDKSEFEKRIETNIKNSIIVLDNPIYQ